MNKRHYEHTLPNIRGSLSNTYTYSYIAQIRERTLHEEKDVNLKAETVTMFHPFRLSLFIAYPTYQPLFSVVRLARSTALHAPTLLPAFGCGTRNLSPYWSGFGQRRCPVAT